jgi:hypothetical protein
MFHRPEKEAMRFTKIILLFLALMAGTVSLKAQEKSGTATVTTNLALSYLSTSNDSVLLTATLGYRNDSGSYALQNAGIEFLAKAGEKTVSLGKANTDGEGNALFKAPVNCGLTRDKSGAFQYLARFAGKGKYEASDADFTAKPAKITITFSTDDSVKTIHIAAVQVEADGSVKPVQKEKVLICVPRLYSLLKIGEVALEDDGTCKLEYPGRLVGDSLGNLTVLARIEESDAFGNVQGTGTVQWGIPKHLITPEKFTRELWTPIAPIWMIITLIIMLTGVWAHYIYAVIQLIKIKRLSKEKKTYF